MLAPELLPSGYPTESVKPYWTIRNPSIKRLIALTLLWGFAYMALSPYRVQAQFQDDSAASVISAFVSHDKGADDSGPLKKQFPLAEDASEKESETETDTDDRVPDKSLSESDCVSLQIQSAWRHAQALRCQVHLKDWNACKRLSILADQASLYLYLFHALKLHG